MLEVSVAKARDALTQLVREAEGGKVVHITRRGKSVAVPASNNLTLITRNTGDFADFANLRVENWPASMGTTRVTITMPGMGVYHGERART